MLLELLSQEAPLEEQDIDDALDEVRQLSLNFKKILESSCKFIKNKVIYIIKYMLITIVFLFCFRYPNW